MENEKVWASSVVSISKCIVPGIRQNISVNDSILSLFFKFVGSRFTQNIRILHYIDSILHSFDCEMVEAKNRNRDRWKENNKWFTEY